jgi:HNH endonuclease
VSKSKIGMAKKLRILAARSNCVYCKKTEPEVKEWHVDHIVPKQEGGTNDDWNLVKACAACNLSKGPKMPDAWLRWRGKPVDRDTQLIVDAALDRWREIQQPGSSQRLADLAEAYRLELAVNNELRKNLEIKQDLYDQVYGQYKVVYGILTDTTTVLNDMQRYAADLEKEHKRQAQRLAELEQQLKQKTEPPAGFLRRLVGAR